MHVLSSCDLKVVKQNAEAGKKEQPLDSREDADLRSSCPASGGGARRAGGGPAPRRGGAGAVARGPAPSGSASGPAPPLRCRFPWPVPRPVLLGAIRLLEGVRSGPQRLVRRGGPGSAYLAVSGSALSLPLPSPPFHSSVSSAAAGAAGNRSGKDSATEDAGVGASLAGRARERLMARAQLFSKAIVFTVGLGVGGRGPQERCIALGKQRGRD